MRGPRFVGYCIGAAVMTATCGHGAVEPGGAAWNTGPEREESAGSGEQGVAYTDEYCFTLGGPAVPMLPVANTACFFTRVAGKLDSLADNVRIEQAAGSWQLDGAGAPGSGLQACARCLTDVLVLPEAAAVSPAGGGVSSEVACAAAGRTAFLTYMGGSFTALLSRELTQLQAGNWLVVAQSPASGRVEARARCVDRPAAMPTCAWVAPGLAVTCGSAADRACFLAMIGGRFQVPAHAVELDKTPPDWTLAGSALTPPRLARAYCVM